jgi:formylglycine-generating enzyme required for sulfatase activity
MHPTRELRLLARQASWLLNLCLVAAAPSHAQAPAAGQLRRDTAGIEQVWVPAGSFRMGSSAADLAQLKAQNPPAWVAKALDSEAPDHAVELTRGFWLDKHEVTHQAFQVFIDQGAYDQRRHWSDDGWQWHERQKIRPDKKDPECANPPPQWPHTCVTWYEAEAYAHWRGGRLPTEAQWEYAARGPQALRYPWGNDWDASRANVLYSSGPQPVGSHPGGASWVGAQDMAGNVMEWVQDWLDVNYFAASPAQDPSGPATGRRKVEKGGWWGSNPFVARGAYRHYEDPPDYQDKHIGFRVVSD